MELYKHMPSYQDAQPLSRSDHPGPYLRHKQIERRHFQLRCQSQMLDFYNIACFTGIDRFRHVKTRRNRGKQFYYNLTYDNNVTHYPLLNSQFHIISYIYTFSMLNWTPFKSNRTLQKRKLLFPPKSINAPLHSKNNMYLIVGNYGGKKNKKQFRTN